MATVIIKDQSRIGRDVVEVGLLKRTFDEYHVRFIAANDNLDTANGFDIMSIFRDVINEWYVADTSRKIKAVFKSRMEKGLRCSGSVCYGYRASKEEKGEWIIDEEAAAVVRRIFQSVLAGETIASIAKALRAENNLVQGKWVEDAFICSGYRHLIHDCTMHHIPTVKIEAAILAVIQRVSWYVRHNEKEFIERVREASDQNQEKTVKECKQKINKAQKRHKELDGLVKKLYEGNATGKIPDKHFTRLLAEYDEEQTGLETSIAEWQRQIENWNADKLKTDQFIQLVKRYTDFSELTTPMLNEFIEKVIVYEGEGRGNDRRQRIDIYLNFIGAFEVPAHIVTPAEVEEQRRQQEEQAAKEARSKELKKARYEKRKAEKREFTARKKAGLLTPEELEAALAAASAELASVHAELKAVESTLREKKDLQKQLLAYIKTKPARDGLKAQKTEKARKNYREQHESDFMIAEAATRYFKAKGITKLPASKTLQAEIEQLMREKNSLYNEYREKREKTKGLQTVKGNIEQILRREPERGKGRDNER